jgi:RNA recognition motif-containing protein
MPEDCKTLFVKGLPYSFKEDDIGDRFRRFGAIKSIRIAYNWQSKQSKGFAYVSFENHDSAKKALLEMNGKEVQGRRIKVDFDVIEEAKKGYKINLQKGEGNKQYNKEILKEELGKRAKKQKDKQKKSMARMIGGSK